MRKHLLIPLVCACALAACNFAPTYRQPELPVADHFDMSATAGAAGARLAAEIDWETFFADPQLKLLIATALQRNRDLAASVARIEQARAFYRIQNAARLPQVNANASATRTKTPLGSIEPQFNETDVSVQFNQFNVQAVVSSFELDFWGRVRNVSEAARLRYLASVEAQRAFRLSLIGNVAANYYAIRSGEEGIALAERTLASRRYALEVAKLRLDAGVTSKVDYEQAAILVTQAQTQLADLQRSTAQQRNQLEVLVGGPLQDTLPPGPPIVDAAQFGVLDPGLPSALLVNRPDILQAEQELRAADADIGAARADFFPRIALTGNFGYVSAELGNLFVPGQQVWSVGALVNMPIFDAGQRQAQLAQTRARRDELVANYQHAVQTAFREVSDALVGRQRYKEQIAAQEQAVEAQRQLAETAELRYLNGISIYLEVVDARRNLFAAEQQLIQLRATALQNGVSLYVALGGGPDAPQTDGNHQPN
ncbi:RND efflux system, outer membrane lipoprotein, NodT family [Paraburkholderia ribeironis]|uniref:RND efflux system, outer membrane lipoprotein, NodT family n=1 Tax=Paraburkholderia ribeironis TaxID=1247936 RepID=A0A1N7SIR8_9BURK|nr:efflux transporter outer membrane subunit [Paraburkholderia ribeironis]SIT47246.1 RND efflux system, outer membrane lipoprotein, NodT family [Paraburkholderia ribeironis]